MTMKRKYQIINNYTIGVGVWVVDYFVWLGCPGNKKKKSLAIYKERRPNLLDLMEADSKITL